ncbi:MAG: hypothetical protein RI907_1538 [Pseudomonadota bacterium]|jgi:hypothetical protein
MESVRLNRSSLGQGPAAARLARSAALAGVLLSLSALVTPAQAGVQWKWKDANGTIQYSDRPPPPGTPEQAILARPLGYKPPVNRPAADPASAASGAALPASATVDPELEARKKKAEEAKQARKKADDEKTAAAKADHCQRARGYLRSLQDGMRITRTGSNGEREVLDDKGRAEETERAQGVIANNCE